MQVGRPPRGPHDSAAICPRRCFTTYSAAVR
jgi:hypothetical protein